ncbi:MAG TPA: molybdenum cofactor guanylyltransferase MobA, partial [Burkholderiaceae bacterium]
MTIDKKQITGLLLAGGQGSRMGNVDKGLQLLRGRTMAAHVLDRLRPQVGAMLINANRNAGRYAGFGLTVVPDHIEGYAGPLAGLAAGLAHCATPYLISAPCDSPFLPADLVEQLSAALTRDGADLAVPVTGEGELRQKQPVFCLLKASLLPSLEAFVAGGGRKMERWFDTLVTSYVPFDDESAFDNINTLAQLELLEAQQPSLADVVSCMGGYDPNAVPVAQAQDIIARFVAPVRETETLPVLDCLGRVLAHDVVSPVDVPAHDNSAMDGYALRGTDLREGVDNALRVAGTAYAGKPYDGDCLPGSCVRIMTGAVMPDGCDTVVPQEFTRTQDGVVSFKAGAVRPGDHRRKRGEDLAADGVALAQGRVLRPSDIGMLASLGIATVAVRRKLRVAIFSTGDELRAVGDELDPGCVYDSNRYTLHCMLRRLGCDV